MYSLTIVECVEDESVEPSAIHGKEVTMPFIPGVDDELSFGDDGEFEVVEVSHEIQDDSSQDGHLAWDNTAIYVMKRG